MRRLWTIIGLTVLLLTVGCGESTRRQNPPQKRITLAEISPKQFERFDYSCYFTVINYDLPQESIDKIATSLAFLSIKDITFSDREAFLDNGLFVTSGTKQALSKTIKTLVELKAQKHSHNNIVMVEQNKEYLFNRYMNSFIDTIYYMDKLGSPKGVDVSSQRLTLSIQSKTGPDQQNTAQVDIVPTVENDLGIGIRQLAGQKAIPLHLFESCRFSVEMQKQDFLVLTLGRKPGQAGMLERELFDVSDKKGNKVRVMVIICKDIGN